MNRPETAFGPDLAVDAGDHFQCVHVRNFVRRDQAWPDRRREILPLGRPQPAGHFLELHVPRAEVIHDRVAGDVRGAVALRDIHPFSTDDAGQLQFVIELGGLQRPGQILIGSDDGAVVALVVDRRLVPLGRNRLAPLLGGRGDMLLKRDEITQRRRIRQWGDHSHVVVPVPHGFSLGPSQSVAGVDRILKSLASRGHRAQTTLKELQHHRRHARVGETAWLRFFAAREQGRIGHVEINNGVAMECSRPHKVSHRRLDAKTDQLHGRLQLMA